ncbi:5-(carboxyamino)imidazole ribonucleotide synthase [Actinomadura madurae]|nr:5-(carboxyamino)imidazole ribonucleotide synthase [Actinomadura madurae]MCP9967385.1 5-(carboxyamino)imidazole ribonucleotide synthase [Actinomadura madurae]MCP9979845.1 5-(carboxyamino)imidazole ribonucleotide synthase [Actinomadura madurae]MCQ0008623.1 5-(carboxyamino)imidazole ribonucleotide synthase [Actinomadura madurae]MCQ0016050.1 5-(carboxyamino)imidazole ribonucleotide synthase [Actinomadura madurae]
MAGGGQLARMTQQAAIGLGVSLRVLAGAPQDSAARAVPDTRVGDDRSLDDLVAFAKGCDVVTFDHEHVPGPHIEELQNAGVPCRPGAAALAHAQDKLVMRERLTGLGVPCPAYSHVPPSAPLAFLEAFAREHGWPLVLKATRGGYDGKGVWIVENLDREAYELVRELLSGGVDLMVEQHVPFERELAALVARSPYGQGAAYPIVETVQEGGICTEVISPAPGLPKALAAEAQSLALRVADELDVVGLLAVELFQTAGGLLVNELAMRPHNSGHWTIEGARTSQFEQHLRAVLDLPLGSTEPTARYTVMANVLGGDDPEVYPRYIHVMAHDPAVKVHMYGKESRPGRKIGHVTALGDDLAEVRERARHAAAYLRWGTQMKEKEENR